jgi:hypothetical protein
MSIRDDATTLLLRLARMQEIDPQLRDEYIEGKELDKLMDIGPPRLSDAVGLLEQNGYADVIKTFGTAPYDFNAVQLTSRGRFEAERLMEGAKAAGEESPPDHQPTGTTPTSESGPAATVTRVAQPVGSPFGFTPADWEGVSLDHEDATRLIVVFGHQWASTHFDAGLLRTAIESQFEQALVVARAKAKRDVTLDFRLLAAGYCSHLFNEIARDIIAADIAVFEMSDLNPNVMIEMGVALTWGTRVHPIRHRAAPKPPSDISGQTWAAYDANGATWMDADHDRRLVKMVERACLLKPRRG